MKKLIKRFGAALVAGVVAALALLATPASAQNPQSIRIFQDSIQTLTVSNGIPFTNLSSVGAYATNIVGLVWSNGVSATNVIAGAGTNGTTKIFKDISLWTDRNGNVPTNCNLSIEYVAGAGNTTTNTVVLVPLYDGTTESTVTGDAFIWPIIAAGATQQTQSTNNPFSRWPGAQKFRVKAIADGTNAAASQLTILDLRVNGWPP